MGSAARPPTLPGWRCLRPDVGATDSPAKGPQRKSERQGWEVGDWTGPSPPDEADNRKREAVGAKEAGRGRKEEP